MKSYNPLRIVRFVLILALLPLASCSGGEAPKPRTYSAPPPMKIDTGKQYTAIIETEKGNLTLELFARDVPLTVNNFVFLSREGFYDGLAFHRVIADFMAQAGNPGTGVGGPGYTFADELEDGYSYDHGVVALANRGPNTNGSQFFIMLADYPLPKAYTIFGKVTEGLEIVADIKVGDEMTKVVLEDIPAAE